MKSVSLVALILVVVGAVNWGLVGLAQFDLVAAIFGGANTALARIVYSLVGIAGLVLIVSATAIQNRPHALRPSHA